MSAFNGSVSLSYPILTPPGAAGLQPNLGLSYSSANGNGMIGRLQADEVGFGWNNTATIDVTQSLKTCHGDDICEVEVDLDGNPGGPTYNQYTLSFNGVGYELIHVNGKASNGQPGRYYAQGHAGLYVELCKTPFSAYCAFSGTNINTQSDVFWRIKSADNTTYRLGFTTNSEQELIYPARTVNVDNLALRWRVDTVTDRFGNTMTYSYYEDYYSGWVHPEYFHAPAGYPYQITYDAYTVTFAYANLSNEVYRAQGYGYVVGWHTRYLTGIAIKAGTQAIRRYALGQDFQRYGTDNDTDDPPLDPSIANQSAWCADMDWVIDFNDPGDPDDNIKYTPDKLPTLRTIHEFGSNDTTAKSTQPDATFTYSFLGTGLYDHADAPAHVRYCFPYLDSVETIYGPADPATPTTAYVWRAAQQDYQSAGSLPGPSVLGRYANLVERETTYSGFANDAPTQNVYFRYTTPNMQGDEDTFQGFNTVERCRDAACTGAWAARETLTFLTRLYSADDAALTGRLQQSETRSYPNTLVARTENTWGMLDGDGNGSADPSRVAVPDKSIQRDYRGATIASRTDYKYDVYGNTTETQEYGERTGTNPWRTLERVYTVNTTVNSDKWLVNLAWRETLWDGPSNGANNKIVRRTRFRYDGAACGAPSATPTLGRLTATDAYVPGYGVSCGGTDYNTTTYTYHATRQWQVTRVTDPAGRYKDYSWTDATRLGATSFTVGATTYSTAYTYDTAFRWQVKDVTAPNGAKTRYLYDLHGRLYQVKAPNPTDGTVGATVKEYAYLDTENPFYVDEKTPAINSTTPPTTRTFYDAVGRPLQARRFNVSGDFNTAVTDTEYDTFGRVRCAAAPGAYTSQTFNSAFDCDAQPKMLYAYDVLGETVSETGYDGVATTTAVFGRERRVTDGEGNLFVYESDELGRLLRVRQPVTAAPAWTMTYTYDLADNLLTATGPGPAVTTLTYDRLGRKLTMDDPDMGIWNYRYHPGNELALQIDARKERLCFYYDASGRPTYRTKDGTDDGDNNIAACPTSAGSSVLAAYTYYTGGTGKGLMETAATGSAVASVGRMDDTFIYDYRGRVTSQVRDIGGRVYTLGTSYDDADRPLTLTYPSGDVVTIGYDKAFAASLASSWSNPSTLVVDLDYNHRGQLIHIDRAAGVPDTTLTYYNQVESFRLDEIQHGVITDGIPDFLYNQYDNLGNVEIVQMRQGGATETQTFGYDGVGRLTSADSTGAASYNYSYTYGAGGNLATRTNNLIPPPNNARIYTYGTPAQHHAHAVTGISGTMTAAYSYDANGNMTTRTDNLGTFVQGFDEENRLESVVTGGQTTSFYYDPDGNRVLTILPNGTKLYTPYPEFDEEVPASGATTQRSHYFLAGQLIAARVKVGTAGSVLYYAFADHLGNVSAWTNISGGLESGSLARYDPYGVYRTEPSSTVNPDISDRGFTGHQMNNTGTNDLGLIYMNARYYLPEIGRFISADTIVPEPKNPQSHNRYSYSYNNPINYTDPTGHCAEIGDDACWSLAEQLWHLYGIDLEFLGAMNYGDLGFFGETLANINDNQRDYVVTSIQEALGDDTARVICLPKNCTKASVTI